MRKILVLLVSILAVLPAATQAADVKTPLGCKIGPPNGPGFALQIRNTTKTALKTDAIINIALNWKKPGMPGTNNECFALSAPLAPGATISHVSKLDRDQSPVDCAAFVSSLHPAVLHENGASETDCD
jgi:hypothetical protein